MTLSDFVKATQESFKASGHDFSQVQTREIIDVVFNTVASNVSGDGISIPSFGTFKVKDRAARAGRNPRTGEALTIPAKKVVTFKSKIEK